MQPVAINAAITAKNRLSCISGGMVVFPSPEHHSDKGYRYQGFRNSPGILAMFAAIRRASSRLSNLTAGNFQQHEIAIQGNGAGLYVQGVTMIAGPTGSFTIHLNKTVAANTNVAWFVIN